MEMVQVEFEYEYTGRDGALVSIKPNDRYILVSRTNDHWWHVRKDQGTKPFYIPAKYVRELSLETQGPLDLTDPGSQSHTSPQATTDCEPLKMSNKGQRPSAVMRVYVSTDHSARSLSTHRKSAFGVSQDIDDIKQYEHVKTMVGLQTSNNETRDIPPCDLKRHSLAPGVSFTSASDAPGLGDLLQHPSLKLLVPPEPTSGLPQLQSSPLLLIKDPVEQQNSDGRMMKTLAGDPSGQSHLYQDSNIYETISDIPRSELTDIVGTELAGSLVAMKTPAEQQQSLDQTCGPIDVTAPSDQVDNESAQNAVYVNVAELRRSISESPPSASSPPCSPPYLDSEGWEVHTDQESGQEYYYHPESGQTTWDNPHIDPDAPAEEPVCSSPSPSSQSPTSASPPAWTSDWKQCFDVTSGIQYFYNPVSGETSWEPPEPECPYPPLMEPLSVHSSLEEGPPPLPEEDYPAEDYPDPAEADLPESLEEEPLALSPVGPHSFPKDYTPSHVIQAVIPRASLDRSAPAGWNLNVDPDGTWVFSSKHSPEQWIKSLDDSGQTYYYLRDGSRSQWNLPEAPVASGQSKVGIGVALDGGSLSMKNWRHTMGPAHFNSTMEEGFFPAHRRNASDYGSEGSSADNSPEMGQHHAEWFRLRRSPSNQSPEPQWHNVQSLEKAGILNKTKVSENGKRVRKNWAQSWTVLHGGVLTFHKDPKSAATGASNKTNQIVPEVTVELRGATIGWAPKDKSSKKNVVELKNKNGVEFLIQYDTESIINDWHKVLVDTIRQLDQDHHQSEEEDGDISEKSSGTDRGDRSPGALDKRRMSSRPSTATSSGGETDQKKVRTKLIKFLLKRPTLQSVKEKGYIRDNVFGCHLAALCAQEKTTIPSFVEKCIRAVEKRGLDMDGLYRVSGNLAVIQKLRFKADHEELDLEDGQWEDIHVITGALKLFFRELPEPLFPFSHFSHFIQAIRAVDYNLKVSYMRELVESLPRPNHDTMELLFSHLRKVINYGEENRMTVQNVAIVFGPTLLRPEMESANIAMHMVFQNQIVELVLNEYEYIFHSS
ncbi:rho GTPase-activating protein 12 isoform X2 [Coregonus clupeaformis]|uniref:rho GTPase-activating protein 12 isoform X2 n=1 Tax=Coregonus clupeaformis TaxID=59861 RepID=UPI001BE09DF8|nr:rho GTPase-activating protein 12 isoform X2 [Coregonus clupeaformis]